MRAVFMIMPTASVFLLFGFVLLAFPSVSFSWLQNCPPHSSPRDHFHPRTTLSLSSKTSNLISLQRGHHANVIGLCQENQTKRLFDFGILISSFTDSMEVPSIVEFLKYSLASLLTMDTVQTIQNEIELSTKFSPCQGPNIELLNKLEEGDALLLQHKDTMNREERIHAMIKFLKGRNLELRILYIPTAMYALNPNSSNTPGKQRQRARADAKKRKNQLVQYIGDMLSDLNNSESQSTLSILTVTLDFDDGSIKQPTGSLDTMKFPKDGLQALTSWAPHVIYVEGGNTFWLHHCMEKGDVRWMELVQNACSSQVSEDDHDVKYPRRPALYMGKSAGAIIAGKYVETATWKGWDDPSVVPGKESYDSWRGTLGMDLVGGASFFPHMTNEWIDLVTHKTGTLPTRSEIVCLRDWDACCIEASKNEVFLVGKKEDTTDSSIL